MPLRRYKNDDGQKLSLGQVLYAKRYNLTLDRNLCKGCDVCKVVCPREAISLKPLTKDSKARAPLADVDVEKCDYHAICGTMCPFWSHNSEHK